MRVSQVIRRSLRQNINKLKLRTTRCMQPVCRHDPESIMVFVTNRCNFACNTCPFIHPSPWSPPDIVPDLSVQLFTDILDRYRGATMVGLVGGEPLLHPDLDDLVRIAAGKKMVVNLSTNGSLLTEERIHQLLRLPLGSINISLDAVDENEFFRLRGGSPGTYQQVKKNAALVGKISKKLRSNISFKLSFVTDQVNIHRMPEFFDCARDLGADTVFCQSVLSYRCSAVTSGETVLWDTPSNHSILESVNVPRDIHFVPPLLVPIAPDDPSVRCIHPFTLLSFDGAGNLSPCCVIPPHDRFGNLSDSHDAWRNGEMMQRFRKEMLGNTPASETICLQCWERFSLENTKK
jgi:MoaA/NifB/PqqE/SkfB family radical SAM enzyme